MRQQRDTEGLTPILIMDACKLCPSQSMWGVTVIPICVTAGHKMEIGLKDTWEATSCIQQQTVERKTMF